MISINDKQSRERERATILVEMNLESFITDVLFFVGVFSTFTEEARSEGFFSVGSKNVGLHRKKVHMLLLIAVVHGVERLGWIE